MKQFSLPLALLLAVCFSVQAAKSDSIEAKCQQDIPVVVTEGQEVHISVAVEEEEMYYNT